MQDITLQQLLEAGCHFGHKSERWHPKASAFIYTKKDGIHIIDLAKTKAGLDSACAFVKNLIAGGGELLFIATKRQAMGVVKEAAEKAGAPYLVERWIGGFLTNWEEVKKNIDKIINLESDRDAGRWKKMPKHEQGKLARYIEQLKVFYGGVLLVREKPNALFVVDIRREHAAVREAVRIGIPVIAIVDTNSDPTGIDYAIPANDDAVGSIQLIAGAIAQAYQAGKQESQKQNEGKKVQSILSDSTDSLDTSSPPEAVVSSEEAAPTQKSAEVPKIKRGRAKKTNPS